MKNLLLAFTAALVWSACSYQVQVLTVNADFAQQDTLLRYSNDTFEIVYNTYGKNGQLSFIVFNKSNVPLYIDWKRSAFIRGMQKQDYWDGDIIINTQTTADYNISWLSAYSQRKYYTQGVMTQQEQITFIPPRTAVTMSKFNISPPIHAKGTNEKVVSKSYKKRGTTKVHEVAFTKENSPVSFRNFLTLSLKHDFSEEFYVDHQFWVSQSVIMAKKQYEGMPVLVEDADATYVDYAYPYRKPNVYFTYPVE